MIVEIFFLGPCAACERRPAPLAARHRRDDQNFWPRALGDSLVLVQPGVLQVSTIPGSFERARVPACYQTLLSKYQGKMCSKAMLVWNYFLHSTEPVMEARQLDNRQLPLTSPTTPSP